MVTTGRAVPTPNKEIPQPTPPASRESGRTLPKNSAAVGRAQGQGKEEARQQGAPDAAAAQEALCGAVSGFGAEGGKGDGVGEDGACEHQERSLVEWQFFLEPVGEPRAEVMPQLSRPPRVM